MTFVKKLKSFEMRCFQLFLIVLHIWMVKRISNEILTIFSLNNGLLLFPGVWSINVNNKAIVFFKKAENFRNSKTNLNIRKASYTGKFSVTHF